MAHLEGLANLEELDLYQLPMTKIKMNHLRKLPKLTKLGFSKGELEDASIAEFKAVRPGITVRLW